MSRLLGALPQVRATAPPLGGRFTKVAWSRSRFAGSGLSRAIHLRPLSYYRGTYARKKFAGRIINAVQTPVAGAIVLLFRTSDRLLVEESLSDANGYYELYSPHNSAHFIMAYLTGSPNIQGTTINSLVGT